MIKYKTKSLIYIIIIIEVVASQTIYRHIMNVTCLSWKCQKCLLLRRHTDMDE